MQDKVFSLNLAIEHVRLS